ncbi:hypothetical protein [Chitinophaga silvisoli]|uniref:Uncharacterized protein n=1 Tax=Chitinophaga silvisoli TaxID=2291814 RepID=A0A3E1NVN1_9BACT|nr:hypothetical protein [Chitinophaga silvisoli]RFM31943.1 hypothetical protein DXN04_24460 [Chitinophaga silvisoli]
MCTGFLLFSYCCFLNLKGYSQGRRTDSIIRSQIDPFVQPITETDSLLKQIKPGKHDIHIPAIKRPEKLALPAKPAISFDKVSISNEGLLDQNYFAGGYYYLNNAQISGVATISKMPLNAGFLHQDLFMDGHSFKNTFKVSFDKQAFLDGYRKQLQDQLSIDQLVPKDSLLQSMKLKAEAGIRSRMDSLMSDYKNSLSKNIPALDTLKDYTNNANVNGIFRNLLSAAYAKAIREKEAKLKQLQESNADKAQMADLQKEIDAYYKLVSIYNQYRELQTKYNLSDLQKKLNEETAQRKKQYDQLMSKPSSVKDLAQQNLQLSGFEELLMSIEKLNIGQHTISLSPLSLYSYLTNGVSIEILTKKKRYLFLMAGKETDLNSIQARAIFTSLYNNDHTAVGLRMGKGAIADNHLHFSLFNFHQSKSYSDGTTLEVPQKNTMVMGLSNRFEIGASSAVELELSRSSAVYKDAVYEMDTSTRRSAFHDIISGSNLAQGLAADIKYTGNFREEGLNVMAELAHVASGYYNPGNPFLSRGSNTGTLQVKKVWKKKFTINARTNIRQYHYTTLASSTWWNFSHLIDLGLKLKGGQQISIRYQPTRGIQKSNGQRILQNAADMVTVNLNLQKILGTTIYRNNINTIYNTSRYANFSMLSSKTLTLTSLQSVTLGDNLVYWNNTYTYAIDPSVIAYMNTSFNTEAGISYKAGDNVSLSSSLIYNSITGYVKQVGGRQSVSATIHKKIETSFYIDVKLNIQESSSYYGEPLTANCSIKYSL